MARIQSKTQRTQKTFAAPHPRRCSSLVPRLCLGTHCTGSYVFDSSASPWMTVTVQGNYTQTAGGSLTLKINGAGSGVGDRVTATGTFTRAGTLTIEAEGTVNNGTWTPVSGATSTGSFATVNLPTPAAQFSLAI